MSEREIETCMAFEIPPSPTQTQHRVINRPSAYVLKKNLRHTQRMSLQNQKDGRPMTQHVRTPPGCEGFAFDDPRRLGTTRRATLS